MLNTNITDFKKNTAYILEQTVKYNEPIHISTKKGNVIMISEEEYNGIIETLYLSSIPAVREEIIEGINTPISDCIREEDVQW